MSNVESELSERQKVCPIVLLVVAVHTEILLDGLVHTFRLTISLGVERGREAALQIHHGGKRFPKTRGEDRTAVGNQALGDAV